MFLDTCSLSLLWLPSLPTKASAQPYLHGLLFERRTDSPLEPPSQYGFYSLSRDLRRNEVSLKITTFDQLDISAWYIRQNTNAILSSSGPELSFF